MHPSTVESMFKMQLDERLREAEMYRKAQPQTIETKRPRRVITLRPGFRTNNEQRVARRTV